MRKTVMHVFIRLCDQAREPDFAIGKTPHTALRAVDIADQTGLGVSTVLAALRDLRNADLITMYKQQGPSLILINHPEAPHMLARAAEDAADDALEHGESPQDPDPSDLYEPEVRPLDSGGLDRDPLSYTQMTKQTGALPFTSRPASDAAESVCLAADPTEPKTPNSEPDHSEATAGEQLVRTLEVPDRWTITPQVVRQCAAAADHLIACGWQAPALAQFWAEQCRHWRPRPGTSDHPMRFLTWLITTGTPETPPDWAADRPKPVNGTGNRPRPDCGLCAGYGWVLGPDGTPAEPATRCRCSGTVETSTPAPAPAPRPLSSPDSSGRIAARAAAAKAAASATYTTPTRRPFPRTLAG